MVIYLKLEISEPRGGMSVSPPFLIRLSFVCCQVTRERPHKTPDISEVCFQNKSMIAILAILQTCYYYAMLLLTNKGCIFISYKYKYILSGFIYLYFNIKIQSKGE